MIMNVAADPAYLAMPDATNVNLLPARFSAYLGYRDGEFPTGKQLVIMFPDAKLVLLTVNGSSAAHGVRVMPGTDVEPGDLTAEHGAVWVKAALADNPAARPVVYASVEGELGYGMPEVLLELAGLGIDRARVRLLSAHYGLGPHICGPSSCKAISVPMDGTQWTNSYAVPGGVVDMSLLRPDFFGPVPVLTETERLVLELPTIGIGESGQQVRTVQGLCVARGQAVTVDGRYGSQTQAAVQAIQRAGHIPPDGIVGPQTWPVLLGVA